MYHVAEQEQINIRWWDFVPPVLGLYWAPHGRRPVIGLDNSLKDQHRLLRCVMAEELGHHFTTFNNCTKNACFNYRNRVDVSQLEFKALSWASQYLIPFDQLCKAVRCGITEPHKLANHFDVTEEMIYFRLFLPDCMWYWAINSPITIEDNWA